MYSRLTPQGRAASFAAIKIFGVISAIVTVAGTVSAVRPAVSGWWNSEPSRPALKAPAVMAVTSQYQRTPTPVVFPPPHQVEELHYDPVPYIPPTPAPTVRVVTVPVPVYVQSSTNEERHYNPIVTKKSSPRREPTTKPSAPKKPPEKMQPVQHRSPQPRPPAANPPARSGGGGSSKRK